MLAAIIETILWKVSIKVLILSIVKFIVGTILFWKKEYRKMLWEDASEDLAEFICIQMSLWGSDLEDM